MGSRRLRCWISPLGLRPLFAIQHHSATNRYFSVNYCRLLLQFAKIYYKRQKLYCWKKKVISEKRKNHSVLIYRMDLIVVLSSLRAEYICYLKCLFFQFGDTAWFINISYTSHSLTNLNFFEITFFTPPWNPPWTIVKRLRQPAIAKNSSKSKSSVTLDK